MRNDAPAEQPRVPEVQQNHDRDNSPLEATREILSVGRSDKGYSQAFAVLTPEQAEKKVVELGFPRREKVVNLKEALESNKEGADKFKGVSDQKAVGDYAATLMKAGFTKAEAEDAATKSLDRLKAIKDGGADHLKGTPAEELARLNKSISDIIDKTGVKDGKLEDGQEDKLTDKDRQNLAKDLAMRFADPARFAVQGDHFTCVLQSEQKQKLEAGNVAEVAELTASVVNKGYAEVKQLDGKSRIVHVDSTSFKPDSESGVAFNADFHGDKGNRGMAGHVWDALAGQMMADLKSERANLPTSAEGIDKASHIYMAAHADKYGATTKTGEGLFKKSGDGYVLKEDNPGAALWDVAHLNKAMGGHDGAVFVHKGLIGSGAPPKGFPPDLRVTTFSSTDDLRTKLGAYQEKTGQSAQICVDAPYLPGGGQNGHGLHAMNISLNKDDARSFRLDNNWSKDKDFGTVNDKLVERATDPKHWNSVGMPTSDTIFRPGSGRNPNETQAEADKRRSEDNKRKEIEREEERKKKDAQLEKDKKDAAEKQKQEEERLAKLARDQRDLYFKQLRAQKALEEKQAAERVVAERLAAHHAPVPTPPVSTPVV